MDHLLRSFLTLEHVTRLDNGGRIDCDVSFVDVPNDAFFIDQESCTITKALLFVEDAIVFDDGTFEIAEQRERDSELFGEFAVGGNAVNTHSENLSVGGFELSDIRLIRFEFLRSTTGEREDVNREYDVFLAFEIAKLVGVAVRGPK